VREEQHMLDMFFIVVILLFFAGCLAYIVACERL
jgi:hypothetical protein